MPSVGSISFDAMHGLPQTYLDPSQVKAVETGCLAIGMKNPESPSEDGGEIETFIKKADEAACIALAEQCRAIVGYIVTITVDVGATVPYQFISDVDCQWRRVGGLGANLYIFTAKWKLTPVKQADSNGNDQTTLAEVYTATIWGQWTRQTKLRCYGAAQGLGSYAGECDLSQKIGVVGGLPENEIDALGKWVEIRAKTSIGGIAKPIWWGVCTTKDLAHTESGPELTFHCVGLVDVFRQAQLNRWYDKKNGTTVTDPGSVLPFNARPAGDATTNATADLENPVGVGDFVIHNRAEATGKPWTALRVVETVLEAFRIQYPGGPSWALTGRTTALDYIFTGNMEFASVFDILQACINPSRMLFFNLNVPLSNNKSGSTVEIEICTGVDARVTIPGKGNPAPADIVIPGAERTTSVDLTPTAVTSWDISQDESDLVDSLYVQAPRPQHVTALGFASSNTNTAPSSISQTPSANSQLTKDWTDIEETLWLAGDDVTRNKPALVHVFRRFRIKNLWDGRPYNAAVSLPLGIDREVAGADDEETGNWGNGGTWPDGRTIKLLRSLPVPAGKAWDTFNTGSSVADLKHDDPPEKIQLFQVASSLVYRAIHDLYDVSVANGSSIEIGRNAAHGLAIKAILDSGKDIVAVVGYEWPLPWRVSWRRGAGKPRDLERSMIIPLTGEMHTWKHIDRNVIVSVTGTTAARTLTGIDVYKPGTIYQALELAKLRFTKPRRAMSWTNSGELDLGDTLKPGVFIKSAKVPYGSRVSQNKLINSLLTRRSWSFVAADPKTMYSAEPSLPEIATVINMGKNANGLAGGPQGVYK